MKSISNITDDASQIIRVPVEDFDIELRVFFVGILQEWFINVSYGGESKVNGVRLVTGTLLLKNNNLPFDFVVVDDAGIGLDPYKLDSFLSGDYKLILFNSDEMEEIRGYPVD